MTLRDAAPTRRVMVVAVMVSMVAFLDSTVINLALPATEHDLGGGLVLQQWIVDGYLLAMAAAILPGGSISDLFGRIPVMRFGLSAFGAGSVLAAGATAPAMLITARLGRCSCSASVWRPPGNQLHRYGVRLAVAHAKRCLNIGTSNVPERGARC